MGQTVITNLESLCDIFLGLYGWRDWTGQKAQRAGPHVTFPHLLPTTPLHSTSIFIQKGQVSHGSQQIMTHQVEARTSSSLCIKPV